MYRFIGVMMLGVVGIVAIVYFPITIVLGICYLLGKAVLYVIENM